jgi:hypothetical protein
VEFTIRFGDSLPDVTITTSGTADVASLLRLYVELRAHPGYRSGLLILADHSSLDTSPLTDLDLERIAAAVSMSEWSAAPRAVAVVVSSASAFEQTKIAIAHMGGSRSNRRAFASREEALAWLQQQR